VLDLGVEGDDPRVPLLLPLDEHRATDRTRRLVDGHLLDVRVRVGLYLGEEQSQLSLELLGRVCVADI